MTMQNYEYREPLVWEEDGTYITIAQMQVFLNEDPHKSIGERFNEWLKYYNLCRMYNMVFDTIEEDPDCGYLYWDTEKEVMSATYPETGLLQQKIDNFKALSFEDASTLSDILDSGIEEFDEDEEDDWGLFHGEN